MNGEISRELKIVVERAVRPVRASTARKRKIREELLAHLLSIFEQELERIGDERAALDQSVRRFGDPRELALEIQRAVPRIDRIAGLGDRIIECRRGESTLTHALRVAAFMFLSYAMTLAIMPPVLWFGGRQNEIAYLELAQFAAACCLAGLFFAVTLLGHGMRHALFSAGARSYVRGAACALLSALVVPGFGFALAWTTTGDLGAGYAQFRCLWWSIPVVPAIMLVAIWRINKDYRDDADWASLAIED